MKKLTAKSKYAQVAGHEFDRYLMALESQDIRVGREAIENLKTILKAAVDEAVIEDGMLEVLFYEGEIEFENKTFCFTGIFEYGDRKTCEAITIEKGGKVSKGVNFKLDYLIVGSDFSPSWKQTGYGNKIERALEIKQDAGADAKPLIIHESHWLKSL